MANVELGRLAEGRRLAALATSSLFSLTAGKRLPATGSVLALGGVVV